MSIQASNPSHLLLSRNPRSPAHPQLAATSTSRQPVAPPSLGWGSSDNVDRTRSLAGIEKPDTPEGEGVYDDEEVVVVHSTFREDAALPGRIKVIVGRYEFWCHKEVLWFACPFFQDVLQGSWAETNQHRIIDSSPSPLHSQRNSYIADSTSAGTDTDNGRPDISDPQSFGRSEAVSRKPKVDIVGENNEAVIQEEDEGLSIGGEDSPVEDTSRSNTGTIYLDAIDDGLSVAEILRELRELPEPPSNHIVPSTALPPDEAQPSDSLPINLMSPSPSPETQLAHTSTSPPARMSRRHSSARYSVSSATRPSSTHLRASTSRTRGDQNDRIDAVIQLHEESAAAFQDFLFWAYPHLECKVTWTNVENLLALACKLIVPAVQKLCEHFLLTHASGKPVMALALAEEHGNAELYREASRFVLDLATWNPEETGDLSEQTQLKLSQRRIWFLERLSKLGSIDVRKEYTCRPECPDQARCQFHLDEKWRQAHTAVCRYGPPQPSVAFRCFRQLETFPTNPSLVMPHPLCQSAAKSWVTTLFDRMFQPKAIASHLGTGTEKYWLFITLN